MASEGKAITSKFTEYLTGKLKERAAIWKQERLFREEQRSMAFRGSGNDDGSKSGGKCGKSTADWKKWRASNKKKDDGAKGAGGE